MNKLLQFKKGSSCVNQRGELNIEAYWFEPQLTAKKAKESLPQTIPRNNKPIKGAKAAKNINKNCCHNLIIV